MQISAGVGAPVAAGERVASPGLLHKHYAPKAQVILWEGPVAAQISEILKRYDALLREGARPIILWMGESPTDFEEREAWVPYQGAREYYGRLRQADDEGYSHVLLGGIHPADAALYNRALRSAGFNRVRV